MIDLQRHFHAVGALRRACTHDRTEIRNPEDGTGHHVR
jgi:hypothetical protein